VFAGSVFSRRINVPILHICIYLVYRIYIIYIYIFGIYLHLYIPLYSRIAASLTGSIRYIYIYNVYIYVVCVCVYLMHIRDHWRSRPIKLWHEPRCQPGRERTHYTRRLPPLFTTFTEYERLPHPSTPSHESRSDDHYPGGFAYKPRRSHPMSDI